MDLLTVAEIAPVLRLTSGRVYQMLGEGRLPCVRFGRTVRIPREAWEQWLAERYELSAGGTLPGDREK